MQSMQVMFSNYTTNLTTLTSLGQYFQHIVNFSSIVNFGTLCSFSCNLLGYYQHSVLSIHSEHPPRSDVPLWLSVLDIANCFSSIQCKLHHSRRSGGFLAVNHSNHLQTPMIERNASDKLCTPNKNHITVNTSVIHSADIKHYCLNVSKNFQEHVPHS